MSRPEVETMGLSATVARACVVSHGSSQAQLLLQLLNVRQVMHCIPLSAHCVFLSDFCTMCNSANIHHSKHFQQGKRLGTNKHGGDMPASSPQPHRHLCMWIQVFPDAAGPLQSWPCLQLAGLFVASLAASMHRDAVWAHVTMQPGAVPLDQMSDALPTVLQDSTMQAIAPLVVQNLYAMYEHPACKVQLQKLILHCCLALRDEMDAAGIRQLSVIATRTIEKARECYNI